MDIVAAHYLGSIRDSIQKGIKNLEFALNSLGELEEELQDTPDNIGESWAGKNQSADDPSLETNEIKGGSMADYSSEGTEFDEIRSKDLVTQALRRVLGRMQVVAHDAGDHYMGTEHLLLALILEDNTIAYAVLKVLGLRFDDVKAMIKEVEAA